MLQSISSLVEVYCLGCEEFLIVSEQSLDQVLFSCALSMFIILQSTRCCIPLASNAEVHVSTCLHYPMMFASNAEVHVSTCLHYPMMFARLYLHLKSLDLVLHHLVLCKHSVCVHSLACMAFYTRWCTTAIIRWPLLIKQKEIFIS